MTTEQDWRGKLEENPLVGRLTSRGAAESLTFWGYVGRAGTEGTITLHPSLEDVGDSIEIKLDDILHVEDVPETILLFGAKVVWVPPDAEIVRREGSTVLGREPAGALAKLGSSERTKNRRAQARPAEGTATERQEGRLRMEIDPAFAAEDCHSPCATCRDCSSVCVCICRYQPPE